MQLTINLNLDNAALQWDDYGITRVDGDEVFRLLRKVATDITSEALVAGWTTSGRDSNGNTVLTASITN